MWLSYFVALAFYSPFAAAGPVNSPESRPIALMNSSGDFILAGDVKSYIHHTDRFIPLKKAFRKGEQLSGGIFARNALPETRPQAILCGEETLYQFFLEKSPSHPNGTWKEVVNPFPQRHIQCATNISGDYAVLSHELNTLSFSGRFMVKLDEEVSESASMVGIKQGFAIFAENAIYIVKKGKQRKIASPHFYSKSTHRITSNGDNSFLISDDFSVFQGFYSEGKVSWKRLPISPCEVEAPCALSVASDTSWAVASYWGTWLGVGPKAYRLKKLSLPRLSDGYAFAHSSHTGEFVYAHQDDGDMGLLDNALSSWFLKKPFGTDAPPQSFSIGTRYVVWKRKDLSNRSLKTEIHVGSPPLSPPVDWIAWEGESQHSVIKPIQSTILSRHESDPWWAQQQQRNLLRQFLKHNSITLSPVRVGIIDTGADLGHPYLRGYFYSQEKLKNERDDDGNGFVDDLFGYDFAYEKGNPEDEHGHGTHVTGLVASGSTLTKNWSLSLNARTTIIRALNASGKSNSIDLARAIRYAVDIGIDIVNCSWGGGSPTQVLQDAFDYATKNGVWIVTSAGNDNTNTDSSLPVPQVFGNVTSVGSINKSLAKSSFSNYGQKTVDFMAPGDNITSTLPSGYFGTKSGTSMAAPIFVSAASLYYGYLLRQNPLLKKREIKEKTMRALCDSAVPHSSSRCGIVNVLQAFQRNKN